MQLNQAERREMGDGFALATSDRRASKMKPSTSSASGVTQLTDREWEVVKLISQDMSTKQIAHRLGISVKTVNFHRMMIKKRLDVRSSVGIARYAIRAHIIGP